MQISLKSPLHLFSFLCFALCGTYLQAQEVYFENIESNHFHNLYKLNPDVYRSEQPSKKGMEDLQAVGIKSVVNLRRKHTDENKLKALDLDLYNLPLKAGALDGDDIFTALQTIQQAQKPVLVHCWHGSDRTGAIVAASRMVFENWSKDQAIAEFTDARFGYHKNMYPNLIPLLESLDIDLLKEKLAKNF
ncbi:dual specificity protein phosphatase family protein [uncultured Formosa sp.]|uniref:fused DSP-PTPase phosphatase/NAD kinase-like protein n=1 Tax=uncultured Formosa sp. TaxID=255435 RepID=UPI00260EB967|nr:dual specificity protein phosphatase family protein [uncultured Formosa sp.]